MGIMTRKSPHNDPNSSTNATHLTFRKDFMCFEILAKCDAYLVNIIIPFFSYTHTYVHTLMGFRSI